MEIAKSLIESRKSATLTSKLRKVAIDILNHSKGVQVASLFSVSVIEVLENGERRMQWL